MLQVDHVRYRLGVVRAVDGRVAARRATRRFRDIAAARVVAAGAGRRHRGRGAFSLTQLFLLLLLLPLCAASLPGPRPTAPRRSTEARKSAVCVGD